MLKWFKSKSPSKTNESAKKQSSKADALVIIQRKKYDLQQAHRLSDSQAERIMKQFANVLADRNGPIISDKRLLPQSASLVSNAIQICMCNQSLENYFRFTQAGSVRLQQLEILYSELVIFVEIDADDVFLVSLINEARDPGMLEKLSKMDHRVMPLVAKYMNKGLAQQQRSN